VLEKVWTRQAADLHGYETGKAGQVNARTGSAPVRPRPKVARRARVQGARSRSAFAGEEAERTMGGAPGKAQSPSYDGVWCWRSSNRPVRVAEALDARDVATVTVELLDLT
jgi:hypothetical protein